MNHIHKLFPALIALGFLCESCVRDPSILPPPIPTIHLTEQTPFKSFLDSMHHLTSTDQLRIIGASINAFSNFNQAIIGYSFRTSVAGKITALGVMLPANGYTHTVTLWDSIQHQALIQAHVPSVGSGKFTYVDLKLLHQTVNIQPNHTYIVSFNSLPDWTAINSNSIGNDVYALSGILHVGEEGNSFTPIIPFTQGAITYQGYYELPYNNFASMTDPPLVRAATNTSNILGVCDIGFTPK